MKNVTRIPLPHNISVIWNFGSILGLVLARQVVTGIFLRMHYVASVEAAFDRVIHIVRDVPGGWWIRNLHVNGARIFFFLMYFHIGRGLYYKSYVSQPRVWLSGVRIYVLRMARAFLGYVLPWGQISLWGATVITNLISALPTGDKIVIWVWGAYSVGQPTLNRFFTLHFLIPLIILAITILHLYFLHQRGRTNPLGDLNHLAKVDFNPYFTVKDIVGFLLAFLGLAILALYIPNILGDPENYIKANAIITPVHIKPEWYFLFAYAILRAVPRKLGGVLALGLSIAVLYLLPIYSTYTSPSRYRMLYQVCFWCFVVTFLLLTWLGGAVIEPPYLALSNYLSVVYFILISCIVFIP